jgi:hypothetical protein
MDDCDIGDVRLADRPVIRSNKYAFHSSIKTMTHFINCEFASFARKIPKGLFGSGKYKFSITFSRLSAHNCTKSY